MDAPTREIRTNHGAMEPPDLPIDTCEARHWIGGHSHREWRTAHRPGDGDMISITLLSLPPETLQRMVSHDAASETGCEIDAGFGHRLRCLLLERSATAR
jgi:hypothetical protein